MNVSVSWCTTDGRGDPMGLPSGQLAFRVPAAERWEVCIRQPSGKIVVEVADDGPGGARADRGSGLRGLADRVASVGGTLRIDSPAGGGTRLRAEIPCP